MYIEFPLFDYTVIPCLYQHQIPQIMEFKKFVIKLKKFLTLLLGDGNGYKISGYPRECYIDGVWNKENPEDWLTEIQLPIE